MDNLNTEKELNQIESASFWQKHKFMIVAGTLCGTAILALLTIGVQMLDEDTSSDSNLINKVTNDIKNPALVKTNTDNKIDISKLTEEYQAKEPEKFETIMPSSISNQSEPSSYDSLFGDGANSKDQYKSITSSGSISSKLKAGTITLQANQSSSGVNGNAVIGSDGNEIKFNDYSDDSYSVASLANGGAITNLSNSAVKNGGLGYLNINPSYLLPQESFIECVLEQRIVSNFDGTALCTVIDDSYSANGKEVLIPKGTKLYGKYSSRGVASGDNRLFIIWNKARTPSLLEIGLESPTTDSLGTVGASGYRDNKFLTRFTSALLVSGIADVGKYVGYRLNGSKGKVTQTSVSGTVTETENPDFTETSREALVAIAQNMIQESLDIRPTITVNQGQILGVLLSKDIDFTNIWKVNHGIK